MWWLRLSGDVDGCSARCVVQACSAWRAVAIGALALGGVSLGGARAEAQTGPFLYIPNFGGGSLSIVDTPTDGVVAPAIGVGTQPAMAAVRGDQSLVYISNSGSNTVSVLNTATNTITATI